MTAPVADEAAKKDKRVTLALTKLEKTAMLAVAAARGLADHSLLLRTNSLDEVMVAYENMRAAMKKG